jgi:hypothetical protein
VPPELTKLLTPLLGLPGTLNLIALGVLNCVIASFGIASLATGLRLRPWGQVMVATAVWLIMADAAFFDLYASPFSEPAALLGLLLVAAGVVYLGRGWRATVFGLVLVSRERDTLTSVCRSRTMAYVVDCERGGSAARS